MKNLLTFIRGDRFVSDERGSTLAELAILLPALILMVATVSEVGRLFQTYNTLSKSTRTAARYLSNVAYDDDPVPYITRSRSLALCGKQDCTGVPPVVPGLELANVVATPEFQEGGGGGNPIRVTISINNYNFTPIFNVGALFDNPDLMSLPIRPSTTMYYMWNSAAGAAD